MKYIGKIGFAIPKQTSPGIYKESIVEKTYTGDIVRVIKHETQSSSINANITIDNQLYITLDPFVRANLQALRYATFMGAKWSITSAEVKYPRLLITLGGLYTNGK